MHTTIKVHCLNGFEAVHSGRSREEAIASFCNAYNVGVNDEASFVRTEEEILGCGMIIETYTGPLVTVRFSKNNTSRISSRVMHEDAVWDFFNAHGSDYIKLDVTPLAPEYNRDLDHHTMRITYVTANGSSGDARMTLEAIPMWLAQNPGTMITRIEYADLLLNRNLHAARKEAEIANARRLLADYEG